MYCLLQLLFGVVFISFGKFTVKLTVLGSTVISAVPTKLELNLIDAYLAR